MTEDQKTLIQEEMYKLKVDLDKLMRTPKRTQSFKHDESIARLEGKISGLGMAVYLLAPTDHNIIEQ